MPSTNRPDVETIRLGALELTPEHPKDLARATAAAFGISRQTAHKHIQGLIKDGLLEAEGKTKGRTYKLRQLLNETRTFAVSADLEEDQIWRDFVLPHLTDTQSNIREICHYGFTEMVNNVIDHSDSPDLLVVLRIDSLRIELLVMDDGVGIFKKIQKTFHLEDPRHALLELSKGKLTTDPDRHTGEGVYFTSRLFDEFSILSGVLYFRCVLSDDDQWLRETEDREEFPGTFIHMAISRRSKRKSEDVFAEAASETDDYRFSRTHVPLSLARYGEERLVARSQAKRVLARFERFSEVMLDFMGVEMIGQAFADEIFRVFARENPSINLVTVNTNPDIDRMINRALSASTEQEAH